MIRVRSSVMNVIINYLPCNSLVLKANSIDARIETRPLQEYCSIRKSARNHNSDSDKISKYLRLEIN